MRARDYIPIDVPLDWPAGSASRIGLVCDGRLGVLLCVPAGILLGVLIANGYTLYALGAFVVVVLLGLALRHPALALSLFVVGGVCTVNYSVALGAGIPDVSLNRVAAIGLLAVFIARRDRLLHPEDCGADLGRWMLVFCVIVVTTSIVRYESDRLVAGLLYFGDSYVIPFFFFFLARRVLAGEREFRTFCRVGTVAAVVLAAIGTYECLAHQDLFLSVSRNLEAIQSGRAVVGYMRSNGPFNNTDPYAAVLCIFLFLMIYLVRTRSRGPHTVPGSGWWLRLVVCFTFAGMLFSMLRAYALAFLLGLALRPLFARKVAGQVCMVALAVLLTLLVGWKSITASELYRNRLSNSQTMDTRFAIWRVSSHLIPEYFLVGAGFNRYETVQHQIAYDVSGAGDALRPSAHNAAILLLVETGIWGFGVYLIMMALVLRYIWRFRSQCPGPEAREFCAALMGILCVYTLPGLTSTSFENREVTALFFVCAGALVGRLQRETRTSKQGEPACLY